MRVDLFPPDDPAGSRRQQWLLHDGVVGIEIGQLRPPTFVDAIGTVFRHFPSKEKLLEALYHERLDQTAERARAAARAPDPGVALFDFLTETVLDSGTKIALADALADAGIDVRSGAGTHGHDLTDALTELLTRAQQAGAVRADIGAPELAAVLYGASRAAGFAVSEEVRSRTVRVILDGLRPPSRRAGARR